MNDIPQDQVGWKIIKRDGRWKILLPYEFAKSSGIKNGQLLYLETDGKKREIVAEIQDPVSQN